jgi:hypothetical protein
MVGGNSREIAIRTRIKGDIHWKETMLKNDAPYSFDAVRSLGTGGGVCHRNGFSLRYHFRLGVGGCKALSGALASSSPDADLSLGAACNFSISATTTCGSGSGGADMGRHL